MPKTGKNKSQGNSSPSLNLHVKKDPLFSKVVWKEAVKNLVGASSLGMKTDVSPAFPGLEGIRRGVSIVLMPFFGIFFWIKYPGYPGNFVGPLMIIIGVLLWRWQLKVAQLNLYEVRLEKRKEEIRNMNRGRWKKDWQKRQRKRGA